MFILTSDEHIIIRTVQLHRLLSYNGVNPVAPLADVVHYFNIYVINVWLI
jgi:hypothetical protein